MWKLLSYKNLNLTARQSADPTRRNIRTVSPHLLLIRVWHLMWGEAGSSIHMCDHKNQSSNNLWMRLAVESRTPPRWDRRVKPENCSASLPAGHCSSRKHVKNCRSKFRNIIRMKRINSIRWLKWNVLWCFSNSLQLFNNFICIHTLEFSFQNTK